jgi:hypothetical protein
MHQELINESAIVGRIVAGLFACLCVYLAVFLREEEDGIWQNRLDKLWMEIDDRAKDTQSTSTALFNILSARLIRILDVVFGARLYSVRAIAASVNFSLAGFLPAFFLAIVGGLSVGRRITPQQHINIVVTALCFVLLGLPFLVFGILPAVAKRVWVSYLSLSLPLLLIAYLCFSARLKDADSPALTNTASLMLALMLAVVSDVIMIATLRSIFASAALAPSTASLLQAIGHLAIVFLAVSMLPVAAFFLIRFDLPGLMKVLTTIAAFSAVLDVSTIAYFLIPLILIGLLVLHRLFWPSLSRLIYPLCRFTFVKNRPLLGAAASLGFGVAFNVGVTLRELLKLLH